MYHAVEVYFVGACTSYKFITTVPTVEVYFAVECIGYYITTGPTV